MSHVVIVGGGIAGLAAAWELTRAGDDVAVTVVEASPRLGGKVRTRTEDGFVLEGGPDAFVARKPALYELVRELGIEDRLLPSNDARGGVAVAANGRLVSLPPSLLRLAPASREELDATPLLSSAGRRRLWRERELPPRADDGEDESVADFVRRRCGREALERLAEPILASLHVGDVERMSVAATCPHLRAAELRCGSLAAAAEAARASRARPPAAGCAPSTSAAPPVFWTLRGGMGELIAALESRLRDKTTLLRGRRVESFRPALDDPARWTVALDDGRVLAADAVVLATPAAAAAALLAAAAPAAAATLRELRAVSVAVVSLAFRSGEVAPPPGFGFFVPRREGMTVLAGTWTSTKFHVRAPAGRVLLRTFVGGAHDETAALLPEAELTARVRRELRVLCGVEATPALATVERWPAGYPQYDVGHLDRIARLESALPATVVLAGSPYHGVGLPDCVQSGRRAATRVVRELARRVAAAASVG